MVALWSENECASLVVGLVLVAQDPLHASVLPKRSNQNRAPVASKYITNNTKKGPNCSRIAPL
jgi:hypothetical protein